MTLDWGHWLKGLMAALIGGGAGGVTNGISANLILPDQVNVHGGLRNMLWLMGVSFAINAALSAFFYLKQSPVPTEREVWTDEQRAAANGKK